jgi:hypothetical protein
MLSVPSPELVSIVWRGALKEETVVLGKFSEAGESETIGVALSPVPVRDAVCGLPVALSAMLRLPLRGPLAVGTKVMEIPQLATAATLVPQVLVCLKSPLTDTREMVRAAEPVFVSVTT